ncbi:hypothetical protein [Methylovirgula ligni]|nr:hypothetical protein [Methylovirgula ligni]
MRDDRKIADIFKLNHALRDSRRPSRKKDMCRGIADLSRLGMVSDRADLDSRAGLGSRDFERAFAQRMFNFLGPARATFEGHPPDLPRLSGAKAAALARGAMPQRGYGGYFYLTAGK